MSRADGGWWNWQALHARWAVKRLANSGPINTRRLAEIRNAHGKVPLRMLFQIPYTQELPNGKKKPQWGALRMHALRIDVSETVDVWALWNDLVRFLKAWRPMRSRPLWAQSRAESLLAEWERLTQ